MNARVLIHSGPRGRGTMTTMKVLALIAVAWGVVFPSLLWSLNHLLHQV